MTGIGPTDDYAAEFPIVRRGYDPESVDRFLARLRVRSLEGTETLERRITELEADLDEARRREEAVHLTFVAATKTKEEMLGAAERQLAEAKAVAKEEAERILSEAQYEAFRIVTEAREEAEAALDEARHNADTLRTSAVDEGASPRARRIEELAQIREEFAAEQAGLARKLDRLKAVTGDLELQLQALTKSGLPELGSMNEVVRTETEAIDDMAGAIPSATSVADEDDLGPGRHGSEVDEEPARRPAPPLPEIDDTPATNRGSFYSRRSAGLPRIGADAANALAAVSALRGKQPEEVDEDFAMRSA